MFLLSTSMLKTAVSQGLGHDTWRRVYIESLNPNGANKYVIEFKNQGMKRNVEKNL